MAYGDISDDTMWARISLHAFRDLIYRIPYRKSPLLNIDTR